MIKNIPYKLKLKPVDHKLAKKRLAAGESIDDLFEGELVNSKTLEPFCFGKEQKCRKRDIFSFIPSKEEK